MAMTKTMPGQSLINMKTKIRKDEEKVNIIGIMLESYNDFYL